MLEEETILLEGAEESQITGSKHKKVVVRDKEEQQLFKKAREKQLEKYCKDTTVKMGGANSCERCVNARQNCLVHPSR